MTPSMRVLLTLTVFGMSSKSFHTLVRSSDFRHVLSGLLVTGLVLVYLFRLWDLNPHVPFVYAGDGLLSLMSFQNMKEGFWYLKSSHLGFPFSQDLNDFPAAADTTNLLFSRLLISNTSFLTFLDLLVPTLGLALLDFYQYKLCLLV